MATESTVGLIVNFRTDVSRSNQVTPSLSGRAYCEVLTRVNALAFEIDEVPPAAATGATVTPAFKPLATSRLIAKLQSRPTARTPLPMTLLAPTDYTPPTPP